MRDRAVLSEKIKGGSGGPAASVHWSITFSRPRGKKDGTEAYRKVKSEGLCPILPC